MSFTHRPHLTPSTDGTFYFAYGSNLSPTQMLIRLKSTPERSSLPIGIARLPRWRWIICERGYANLVYSADDNDESWGVLYDMSPEDEKQLDRFEGVDWDAPEAVAGRYGFTLEERPIEHGEGDYNKLYLEVEVVAWRVKKWEEEFAGKEKVRVLVYVDEFRTSEGQVGSSYAGRMNRGIEESLALGLDQTWVDKVIRRFIPADVKAPKGYVGEFGYRPPEDGDAVQPGTDVV